jgi:hypothetical protein
MSQSSLGGQFDLDLSLFSLEYILERKLNLVSVNFVFLLVMMKEIFFDEN